MKRLFFGFVFIMLFSLQIQAGIGLFGLKGEIWNKLDKPNKHLYIQGLFDGLVFSEFKIQGVRITTKISIKQYIYAIDKIYSDYRNSLIPVPIILKIVTLEVNGLQKDKIEAEIINSRKQFSDL